MHGTDASGLGGAEQIADEETIPLGKFVVVRNVPHVALGGAVSKQTAEGRGVNAEPDSVRRKAPGKFNGIAIVGGVSLANGLIENLNHGGSSTAGREQCG